MCLKGRNVHHTAAKSQSNIASFSIKAKPTTSVAPGAAPAPAVIDLVTAEAAKAKKAAEEAKKQQDERVRDAERKKAARTAPLKTTSGGSAIAREAQVSLKSATVVEWKKRFPFLDVFSASAKNDVGMGLAHCEICVGASS